jgi:hypothetical protein
MALQGFLRGLSLLTGLSKLQPSSSRVDGIGNHHQELSFVASPQEQLIITLDKPVRVEVGIASASKTLFNLHESLYDGTRHNVSGLLFRSHSGRYSSRLFCSRSLGADDFCGLHSALSNSIVGLWSYTKGDLGPMRRGWSLCIL